MDNQRADDLFIEETLRHCQSTSRGEKWPDGMTNYDLLQDIDRCINILEARKGK